MRTQGSDRGHCSDHQGSGGFRDKVLKFKDQKGEVWWVHCHRKRILHLGDWGSRTRIEWAQSRAARDNE